MDKNLIKKLKELSKRANPRVEIGYWETSINKSSVTRCFALGTLKKFYNGLIRREVHVSPLDKSPFVQSINIEEENPFIFCIPLEAIFKVSLLVPKE